MEMLPFSVSYVTYAGARDVVAGAGEGSQVQVSGPTTVDAVSAWHHVDWSVPEPRPADRPAPGADHGQQDAPIMGEPSSATDPAHDAAQQPSTGQPSETGTDADGPVESAAPALPTMADLDALAATLDRIDAALAAMDTAGDPAPDPV